MGRIGRCAMMLPLLRTGISRSHTRNFRLCLTKRFAGTDKAALDFHHKSPMMAQIAALREKYKLRLRVERYVDETN